MSPARRFVLAGVIVGVVEGALGVLASPVGLGPYLWACAAASAAIAIVVHRLLAPRRDDPGDDDGGLRRGTDDDPPPPPWWPDFEDAFRAYARERERGPEPV
jgi:hypothetical protein